MKWKRSRLADTENKLVATDSKKKGGRGNAGVGKKGYYVILWNHMHETLENCKMLYNFLNKNFKMF